LRIVKATIDSGRLNRDHHLLQSLLIESSITKFAPSIKKYVSRFASTLAQFAGSVFALRAIDNATGAAELLNATRPNTSLGFKFCTFGERLTGQD